MAEEKTEKKKAGIVRRTLKWIGLGLLALLLIASIIFQAPWKVVALLVIVLLACTALPKPARKYFWLTVSVAVIALIIWVFLPDDTEGWRPYTFDEELTALEAKRTIPDSENAATIYNQLLENYNEYVCRTDVANDVLSKLPMREPWSSKDHPELAEWLKDQQGTIARLLEASKVEKCRFPIKANIVTNNQWSKRSQTTRHWALLFITAASNDIAEGRIEQALEKYIAVLQMGKHQCQQPTMVDLLVGIAIEALATNQLNRFVVNGDVTEQHLSIIESALSEIKHDWSYDLLRILEYEKLVAKKELAKYYEFNPEGKIRLSRDPWEEMRAWWKKQLEANQIKEMQTKNLIKLWVYLTYWQKKLIRAKTILLWFCLPSSPQKAAEIIDKSFERYYEMAKPDFDWDKMYEKLDLKFRLNYRYTIAYPAAFSESGIARLASRAANSSSNV